MSSSPQRRAKFALALLFVLTVFIGFQTQPANALVPTVVNVTPWNSGTHTMLNITINHTPPPSLGPSHYVDTVRVEVNGTVHDINQTTPQSTETFMVQYDIGEAALPTTVRVQAHCIVHGWSSWSETMTVPEYSLIFLTLILSLGAIAVLMFKFRAIGSRNNDN